MYWSKSLNYELVDCFIISRTETLHEKFQTISIPRTAKYSFMQGEFVGVGRSSANAAMKVRRMRETGHSGRG